MNLSENPYKWRRHGNMSGTAWRPRWMIEEDEGEEGRRVGREEGREGGG